MNRKLRKAQQDIAVEVSAEIALDVRTSGKTDRHIGIGGMRGEARN